MSENNYGQYEQGRQRVVANPIVPASRQEDVFGSDDIEVIDLDQGRSDIKPTTWH